MNEKVIELLCVGNAIVDVFAGDGNGLALRYGLNEPVQHVEIGILKAILSELGEIMIVSGGGAANAAKISGFLGANVGFIGAIGDDNYGRLFEEDLKAAGVRTNLIEKRSPTGICLVLQTGEGMRIAASPSAALELSESDISGEEIKKAKVVVIDGFMLGRRGLVRHLLALANKHGAAVSIDLGSAAIAAEEAAEIASYIVSYIASNGASNGASNAAYYVRQNPFFLFMNEDEAASYHNALNRPAAAFEQTREFFRSLTEEKPFLVIVVKLGRRGAVCFSGGDCFHAGTEAVEPVETTGAGDAFCGAFLTAWARGKSLVECAALGNKAARIVLEGAGTKVDKTAFKNMAVLLESTSPQHE